MLGNPPASLLVKHMPIWIAEAPALCGQFARDLLAHITATAPSTAPCLSEDSEDFSADDEDDLFETLSLPPNFSMDPLPSDVTLLQPLNPLGHQFVGKYIYYKWPQTGWCVGRIKQWYSDPSVRVWRRVANFEVFYDCDRTTVTHLLSPDNYNADGNGLALVGSWVYLSYYTPMVLPPPYIPRLLRCLILF